jgi:hypothetical protein
VFNQSIEPLGNCKSLQRLAFGESFDQSIEPLVNCRQLIYLCLSTHYNQPSDMLKNVHIRRGMIM